VPASMILSLTLLAAMIQGATDGCCEMKAVTSIGGGAPSGDQGNNYGSERQPAGVRTTLQTRTTVDIP